MKPVSDTRFKVGVLRGVISRRMDEIKTASIVSLSAFDPKSELSVVKLEALFGERSAVLARARKDRRVDPIPRLRSAPSFAVFVDRPVDEEERRRTGTRLYR